MDKEKLFKIGFAACAIAITVLGVFLFGFAPVAFVLWVPVMVVFKLAAKLLKISF